MINKAFAAAEQSFGLGFGEQDAFPPDEYRLLFKLRFSDSYGVHEKERMCASGSVIAGGDSP